jgi:predicted SnoaL-like aldol condensation-catalyzing enzyme
VTVFKRLAETSPRVEIVRMFEDGDYVFGHVEYDFAEVVTGFEVFRFDDGSRSSTGTTSSSGTTSQTPPGTP